MQSDGFFFQALVYLTAAVTAVPLAKRAGLGSVLGYLLAGVIIGPAMLGLVGAEGQDVMHFAEFGVVMMLFLVGLELEPSLLWRLRTPILGLGGLQVVATTAVLAGMGVASGLPWREALAAGVIGAMSSTAIVLQSLAERGQLKSAAGQSAFAVLLFQDIAVIPILALLPLLAAHEVAHTGGHEAHTWVDGMSAWGQGAVVLAVVAGLIAGGRTIAPRLFRAVAHTRLREIFVAMALLLVVGIAILFTKIGLSPALGTFVAGVVLAGSEYRHELESDIEPFKGLLLGLFFISVGASIDVGLLGDAPGRIGATVAAVIAGKLVVLIALGRAFRLPPDQVAILGFNLAQVGEFAFVLLSFSVQQGILTQSTAAPFVAATALTMAATPLVALVCERVVLPRLCSERPAERAADTVDEDNPVIIAGYGRFGQIAGRFLRANGIGATVLEHDSEQVELLRRFGNKVYYGDASRYDLLEAAGAARAKVILLATDSTETQLELVHTVRRHFPDLQIVARAQGRPDAYQLINAGVEHVLRETFDASLRAGVEVMGALGVRAHRSHRLAQMFRAQDEQFLREMASADRESAEFVATVRQRIHEVGRVMQRDRSGAPHAWDDAWSDESLRADVLAGTFRIPTPADARAEDAPERERGSSDP